MILGTPAIKEPEVAGSRTLVGARVVLINKKNVETGTASITNSAAVATRYRKEGRRDKAMKAAASAATARHCHREWIRAQPRAPMTSGESQLPRTAIVVFLVSIQNAVKFVDFFT